MMEATAVSLTRTVLDGVLGSVGTAMADEAALLLGVPREVEFIRSEMQMMQSFLRVQSSAACSDGGCYKDTVRTCVKQVRDLACDLEDCLLDFTMTMHASRGSWLQCGGPDLAARHRVADRIRLLKASLEELNQRNQRYNVFAADASVAVERSQRYNVFAAAADGRVELNQGNPRYVIVADHGPTAVEEHRHGNADEEYQLEAGEEHQDIQRNKETKQLADLVREQSASVVSVWGMGGMGKSSLVRMLYNDRDLIDGFDGRAWVTVSHPLDCTDELERRLKKQLGVDPSGHGGLPAWLGKKRCLVVVDDVSSQEEWEHISRCLGAKGAGSSRVVVTTRREDVAELCAGKEYKYKLEPLGNEEARKLLCQRVRYLLITLSRFFFRSRRFDTKVTQLPVGITKLEKLRYLVCGINFANDLVDKTRNNNDAGKCTGNLFKPLTDLVSWWRGASPSSSSTGGFSVAAPKTIKKLRNLQTLGVVHITQGSEVASNLGKLTSLRRLGVYVDANEDVERDLCNSVASLVRLERLEVRSESLEFLKNVKTPPKHLTALRLSGRLHSLPSWMMSLNDLAKTKLIQTRLRQDDIVKIGQLQNLTLLALWEESFEEESLRFGKDTFKKLKLLYIEGLKNVSAIRIEDGALPLLENLQVRKCNKLHDREEDLSSVLSLVKLNELVLKSCGEKPELEKALQRQISGSRSVIRPKLIIGKSIVTKPM
ncbi:hypothetical protein ACQ4PT_029281 [Festuca glaucescens]